MIDNDLSVSDNTGTDNIEFYVEDTIFQLEYPTVHIDWLKRVILDESGTLKYLCFIFCSDDFLLNLNQTHLQHDTLTDVITFPYDRPPLVHGDIFISVDRVRENSQLFATTFSNELARVMVHGVFHLLGYGDKTEREQLLMREKEEKALTVLGDFSQS